MPVSPALCDKCTQIIEWRKSFRKYKPLSTPRKCVQCERKSVKDAYHVVCFDCSQEKRCCAKCLQSHDIAADQQDNGADAFDMDGLSERQKRTIRRKVESGIVDVDEVLALIERFRLAKGSSLYDDDDDFLFSDEDDFVDNENSDDAEDFSEEDPETEISQEDDISDDDCSNNVD